MIFGCLSFYPSRNLIALSKGDWMHQQKILQSAPADWQKLYAAGTFSACQWTSVPSGLVGGYESNGSINNSFLLGIMHHRAVGTSDVYAFDTQTVKVALNNIMTPTFFQGQENLSFLWKTRMEVTDYPLSEIKICYVSNPGLQAALCDST